MVASWGPRGSQRAFANLCSAPCGIGAHAPRRKRKGRASPAEVEEFKMQAVRTA